MMLPSRLGCPLSLKTPNMGNTGRLRFLRAPPRWTRVGRPGPGTRRSPRGVAPTPGASQTPPRTRRRPCFALHGPHPACLSSRTGLEPVPPGWPGESLRFGPAARRSRFNGLVDRPPEPRASVEPVGYKAKMVRGQVCVGAPIVEPERGGDHPGGRTGQCTSPSPPYTGY